MSLCECGCGVDAGLSRNNSRIGQPNRFIKGHHLRRPPIKRFNEKWRLDSKTGCHIWTGALNADGYGRFGVNGETQGAHRIAYELTHGSIPPGLSVCHRCDNPSCVNPDHLFLGTQQENMRDKTEKDRGIIRIGAHNLNAKLTEVQVREIKRRYQPRLTLQRELAKEYGVSPSVISGIICGNLWSHVV